MKTTKTEFEEFKVRGQYWQDFWGLSEWRITYKLEAGSFNAETRYSVENMSATIALSTTQPEEMTMDKLAFHEMSELLVVGMSHKLRWYLNEVEVASMTHYVIRKLENCVFDKLK